MSQLRLAVVVIVGLLASPGIAQAGGTFRYSLDTDIDYVDPALAYYAPSWEIEYATCAMLVNYPDAPAPRGARLVPDAAVSMPTVSRNGRVYTFKIRPNLRFSSGTKIGPGNFAYALNRVLNRRMSSPGQPFYGDIVGAKAVIDGEAVAAHGIRVLRGNRLQIRLNARRPDFLARLAMPFACAISRSTPIEPDGIKAPVIGSGPYYVAEWTPKRLIILRRNRFYRGPRPHRLEKIVYDIGQPLATIRLKIDDGTSDHGPVPSAAHAELGQRYGVRRRSPGRYFANPTASLRYLAMNHERELFGNRRGEIGNPLGNVNLKKAVNLAIDRTAMLAQRGAYAGVLNDQYLPPTMRGFRNEAIYPARPNLERARPLAAGNTRSGKVSFYACSSGTCRSIAQIVQRSLAEIGLDVDIRLFPPCTTCGSRAKRGEPFDLSMESWHSDYFDPNDFLFLLDGRTIRPEGNTNVSYFSSASYSRKIAAAASLTGQERYRAFGALDVDLAKNAAPLASYATDNDRRFFSERVRNFFQHPVYGLDLPAIAVE